MLPCVPDRALQTRGAADGARPRPRAARVATVPTERCAAVPRSIAFINSLGNLGGFVGPYLMGWAHDTLGPRCADAREGAHPAAGGGSGERNESGTARGAGGHDEAPGCISQWGWATIVLALVCSCITAAAWMAARRAGRRSNRSQNASSPRTNRVVSSSCTVQPARPGAGPGVCPFRL